MYIERKSGNDTGPATIGRVTFSTTGRTICYNGESFQSCKGQGIGANYFDVDTGDEYWISGPKKNGQDRHWTGSGVVEIDDEVVDEYWRDVRGCPPPKNPKVSRRSLADQVRQNKKCTRAAKSGVFKWTISRRRVILDVCHLKTFNSLKQLD